MMKIPRIVLDTLFPIRCLGCQCFDVWLCTSCTERIASVDEQKCFLCTKEQTRHGEICPRCQTKETSALDALLIASTYQDVLLKKVIHYYKYRFITDLAVPLGSVLRHIIIHTPSFPAPDLIIPVPLHKKRLRWRGFNQSTELARTIDTIIPIDDTLLVRTRHTRPQMTLRQRDLRHDNLTDAFMTPAVTQIADNKILLIDDITTTGATLTHCAKTLKAAGAQTVSALVLARE